MITVVTRGATETRAVAAAVAALARPGDVVALEGELGAGKTTFAQGFARGLDVTEQVTSPTFTLVRHYRGRLELNHLDVYRLDRIGEVLDLGLAELLDGGAVTLVEWGDVIAAVLPPDRLEVRLAFDESGSGTAGDPDARRLELCGHGPGWAERAEALRRVLEPWVAPC